MKPSPSAARMGRIRYEFLGHAKRAQDAPQAHLRDVPSHGLQGSVSIAIPTQNATQALATGERLGIVIQAQIRTQVWSRNLTRK